jgi:mono/diheme cytochrome c family protein
MRPILPAIALAALAASCGLALAQPAPPAPPPAPAAGAPAPADAAAAVDPGLALIQGRCNSCHSADLVLQTRRPKAAWRDLINEMVGKGAQVSDPEADQIQAYLEKNQSIAPPPP